MSEKKPKPKDATLGECVTRLRKEAGLSVEEAAKLAGMTTILWSEIEMGTTGPRGIMLWPMAIALGVRPVDFFA